MWEELYCAAAAAAVARDRNLTRVCAITVRNIRELMLLARLLIRMSILSELCPPPNDRMAVWRMHAIDQTSSESDVIDTLSCLDPAMRSMLRVAVRHVHVRQGTVKRTVHDDGCTGSTLMIM